MPDVTPFNFRGETVRVVMIDGRPWWVVNDVCVVLEINNPRMALDRIDDEYVSQADVLDGRGLLRSTNIINEPGLYELIFRSDKPGAKDFRRWVFEVVLPEIRETGSYSPEPRDSLDAAQDIINALRADRDRIRAVEGRQDRADGQIQVIESQLAGVLGHYGEFTALGYAKRHDLRTDRAWLNRLGRKASALMREAGREPHKREDATFGDVNVYPEEFLAAAVKAL